MAASQKPKKKRSKVPEELQGLAKEISEVDVSSKDSIVEIGVRLEKAWTAMRVAGVDNAMLNLLKDSLKVLQNLYQDKLRDAQAVWSAVQQSVQAAEDSLAGETGGVDEVLKAVEKLKRLMEDASPIPLPPLDEGASESLDALSSIENVASQMMVLDPSEDDGLISLREELIKITGMPDVTAEAVERVKEALSSIEMILQGRADDPHLVVEQVTDYLGQAAQAQESPGTAVASPAASKPPAESASKPQGTPKAKIPPAPVPSVTPETQSMIEFPAPAVMGADVDEELLSEYIVESLDHISNAESALLELESNPEDRDQIDVVFRAYHTIKGTSGFLGFDRIQKLAHLAENMLDRAREGHIKIRGGYADLCLRSCDSLRTMLQELRGVKPGQNLKIPEDLVELLAILSDPEKAGYGEQASAAEPLRVGDILVARDSTSRRKIESLEKSKGEKKLGAAAVEQGVVKPTQVVDAIRTQKQLQQGGEQSASIEGSIRVGTNRLDSLINMVGELVIAQSMVAQDPEVIQTASPRLQRSVSHAGKIIRELQDLTMSLRMVPLKGVFQKMNRLVRDLARKSGKQVQFITEGEETEIDRNMVESLNDPFVHMIRNSVDHGVETPEQRRARGKDPTGTVLLKAYHAAGNVVIVLQDDGNGLNRERIYSKAVEKGVIESGREMSDADVYNLIFAPGFSTAEKITDVSGRGVGMDVVKRNIERLRGRVEVSSVAGEGTTFHVRLPLTMAITDAMILRVGQSRYLLPTVSIEQSFQPEPSSISTVTGRGEMVMLRGELLPMFRLHELFSIEDAVREPHEGLLIVIEGDGRRCALMVDELLGQQQVVIKSLGRGMASVPGISGGAILGDGRVGLILDAIGLLQLAEGRVESADLVLA
ncbi:MAG: chemotaxis protein CheW [Phycisphaerae bacterium]|nr:chemotaxis protein CheW [Phycisphaerae bacterium]